jgi:zinc transporter
MKMPAEFLHSYILDGEGGRRVLDAKGVAEWTPEAGLLWVHIDLNNESARNWLEEDSGLSTTVIDSLLAAETRPRSHVGQSGSLVVLRGVNMNPGDDPEDMVAVRVWLDANRIISTRRRRLLSVQDVREELDEGVGPSTTGEFLIALISRLADRIGDFVNAIEDHISDAEDRAETGDDPSMRKTLSGLRRQIAAVRRFLAPQRDALDRLYRQPGKLLSDTESNDLREEADRMTRYLEDIDLARERLVVMQEEFLAVQAQEQNSRMYVLSVVAAVFLPLTFVTGLLGMNVGGLPGLESPNGFLVSIVVMVVAGAALLTFFRWKRWL